MKIPENPLPFSSDLIPLDKCVAYYGPFHDKSQKLHTIIIVYNTGEKIEYFYITSQIEKARERCKYDEKALVFVNPSEWEILEKDSCIQCGRRYLKHISVSKFRELYEKNEVHFCSDVPEQLIKKIKKAVCYSKTYPPADKAKYINFLSPIKERIELVHDEKK
ncbi:MAG: hypothetical protein LBL71_00900 [Endomicrobium sp.]|jgi:DNA modification methylase|nr:hypothetical protein [Endomicrobium sp.]